MCGICGIFSHRLNDSEIDAFRDLMMISTLRGFEGSGVAAVPEGKKSHNAKVIKSLTLGAYLAVSPEFDTLIKHRPKLLLGHTRSPTRGAINKENSHPHRDKHIVGVHNGTLYEIAGNTIKDENDSKLFFSAVAQKGIKKAIEETRGAYAFAYIDEKDGTLNFLRNNLRELYFAFNKNETTMCWASEEGFLKLILSRRFGERADEWKTYSLKPNRFISYPLKVSGKLRTCYECDLEPKSWSEVHKNKTWSYKNGIYTEIDNKEDAGTIIPFGKVGGSRLDDSVSDIPLITHQSSSNNNIPFPLKEEEKNKKNQLVIDIKGELRYSCFIDYETVENTLTTQGCSICYRTEEVRNYDRVRWLSRTDFICLTCLSDEKIKRFIPAGD